MFYPTELGCLVRPCTNGGSCIYVSNMYTCSCQIGYAGSICDVAVGGSRGPSAAPTPPVHQGKVDNQGTEHFISILASIDAALAVVASRAVETLSTLPIDLAMYMVVSEISGSNRR